MLSDLNYNSVGLTPTKVNLALANTTLQYSKHLFLLFLFFPLNGALADRGAYTRFSFYINILMVEFMRFLQHCYITYSLKSLNKAVLSHGYLFA